MNWDRCLEKVDYQIWDWVSSSAVTKSENVPTINCIFVLFERFIFFAFFFLGIIAVILVMIAAVRFILSGGDAKQIGEAKKMLTFVIIGFLFVIFSFFLLNTIAVITGVSCIRVFGFQHCI